MATRLTVTAYYTRRAINWGILAILLYFILRIFWGLLLSLFLVIFPPKAPPPNHAFGVLPVIQFPEQTGPRSELTFRLETIQGTVPAASASANVYFMPKSPANLLAITKTQDFARRLDLNPEPIQETKNIYRFSDADLPLRMLRYDIVSNNFMLRYFFEQDTGLFIENNLPLVPAAVAEARSVLQNYNLYQDDLALREPIVRFLKLSGDTLVETTSLSQSNAVRVDFFRGSIFGAPIVTPYPDEGQVSFVFSGSTAPKKRIIQFSYTYWPIDFSSIGTYALKTSTKAWEEIQGGGGYIARYPKNGTAVTIRNVYLGYYDSIEAQNYLQPVFVFEGDEGFLAYVQAIETPWVE